jgi:arginine/lysine/ornithine decarboxylase
MRPGESWHGFKDLPDNWSMLDPIKVSILAPGMGDDGELEENGVPAALVTAWLGATASCRPEPPISRLCSCSPWGLPAGNGH